MSAQWRGLPAAFPVPHEDLWRLRCSNSTRPGTCRDPERPLVIKKWPQWVVGEADRSKPSGTCRTHIGR
jgi:hypothetical protein